MQSRNVLSVETLIALLIQAGSIQSLNYDGPDPGETFADAGTLLDLINGDIISTAIAVDGSTGALAVRGDITAATLSLLDTLGVQRVTFAPDTFPVETLTTATGYQFAYEDPAWTDPDYFAGIGFGARDAFPTESAIARLAAGVDSNNFAQLLVESLGAAGNEFAQIQAIVSANGYFQDYAYMHVQMTTALAEAGFSVHSQTPNTPSAGVQAYANLSTGVRGVDIDGDLIHVNNQDMYGVGSFATSIPAGAYPLPAAPTRTPIAGPVVIPAEFYNRVIMYTFNILPNFTGAGPTYCEFWIISTATGAFRWRFPSATVYGAAFGQRLTQSGTIYKLLPAGVADSITFEASGNVAGGNLSIAGGSDLNSLRMITFRSAA